MDIFAKLERAADAPDDPIALFQSWLTLAESTEPNDPNAMSLATIDSAGRPAVRIVLLKAIDERGFVFYTNRTSHKGTDLSTNAVAALCFHWKTLRAQVRVTGSVEWVSNDESDAYYNTRPIGSRIGAWASQQSQILESRTVLCQRVDDMAGRFARDEKIPRPPHWGGYRVKPESIEFWHDGADRLHTRVLYTLGDGQWTKVMLYP